MVSPGKGTCIIKFCLRKETCFALLKISLIAKDKKSTQHGFDRNTNLMSSINNEPKAREANSIQ